MADNNAMNRPNEDNQTLQHERAKASVAPTSSSQNEEGRIGQDGREPSKHGRDRNEHDGTRSGETMQRENAGPSSGSHSPR